MFSALPSKAQANFAKLSREVDGAVPIDVKEWAIQVSALPQSSDTPTIVREVAAWANKSKLCLYYFECLPPIPNLDNLAIAFSNAKARDTGFRAYSRLNRQNASFYVGSSQSVAKRLGEHLGYGASRTYALQFLHWAQPLGLNLRFVCAKYPESTPYEIVQALEDALWEQKQPMFGRQGRK